MVNVEKVLEKYKDLETTNNPALSPTASAGMWGALKELYQALKWEHEHKED